MPKTNRPKPDIWHLTCDLTDQDRRRLVRIMDHLKWPANRCIAQALHLMAVGLQIPNHTPRSARTKISQDIQQIDINIAKYKEKK